MADIPDKLLALVILYGAFTIMEFFIVATGNIIIGLIVTSVACFGLSAFLEKITNNNNTLIDILAIVVMCILVYIDGKKVKQYFSKQDAPTVESTEETTF